MGICQRRTEGFCGILLAFRRWDAEARGVDSGEAGEDHQASLVACDATMDPEDFNRRLWFRERCLFLEQPEARVTACRSTGSQGLFLERTYYYDSVSKSLQGNIETIVLRVFFKWKKTQKTQEVHEVKMPHSFCTHWCLYFCGTLCVLWFIVFLLYFVFLWYVVVFVLWYVCVCVSKDVLGVVFLHGEARVTICWTQGVIHFKKRAELRMWLNLIAFGDDFRTLSGTTLCPLQVMRAKFCVE